MTQQFTYFSKFWTAMTQRWNIYHHTCIRTIYLNVDEVFPFSFLQSPKKNNDIGSKNFNSVLTLYSIRTRVISNIISSKLVTCDRNFFKKNICLFWKLLIICNLFVSQILWTFISNALYSIKKCVSNCWTLYSTLSIKLNRLHWTIPFSMIVKLRRIKF